MNTAASVFSRPLTARWWQCWTKTVLLWSLVTIQQKGVTNFQITLAQLNEKVCRINIRACVLFCPLLLSVSISVAAYKNRNLLKALNILEVTGRSWIEGMAGPRMLSRRHLLMPNAHWSLCLWSAHRQISRTHAKTRRCEEEINVHLFSTSERARAFGHWTGSALWKRWTRTHVNTDQHMRELSGVSKHLRHRDALI